MLHFPVITSSEMKKQKPQSRTIVHTLPIIFSQLEKDTDRTAEEDCSRETEPRSTTIAENYKTHEETHSTQTNLVRTLTLIIVLPLRHHPSIIQMYDNKSHCHTFDRYPAAVVLLQEMILS